MLARLVVAVDNGTYRREGEQASIATDETLGQFIDVFERDWVDRRRLSDKARASLSLTLDVACRCPRDYGDDG